MSWTTPRVWTVAGVSTAQMNEVSEQLAVCHKGDGDTVTAVVNPDASEHYDINDTDSCFEINSLSESVISLILTENREPNNKIIIINNTGDILSLKTGSVATGNYKPIKHRGAAGESRTVLAYEAVQLVYNGSYWFFMSPTV